MDIEVKVITRASRNHVVEEAPGRLRVYLTKAPEKGKANKALIDLVAEYFSVRKSDVVIKKGLHSSLKLLLVPGPA
ncbi:MAG: DUF167 domain-containing protein [Candidatus Omnitrophota bacterium]